MYFAQRLEIGLDGDIPDTEYIAEADVPVSISIVRMLCASLKSPCARGETLAHALLGYKRGGLTGRMSEHPDPCLLSGDTCLDVILRRMRADFFVETDPHFAEVSVHFDPSAPNHRTDL